MFKQHSRDPHNVRLEVDSWRKLGSLPSAISVHAQPLRDLFRIPAYFSPVYKTESHLNECGQPGNTQIPGWLVDQLYCAEQANLDFFSRACWPVWESVAHSFSDCIASLDGLFIRNLITPQQPYYLYRDYAEIAANTRIVATRTDVEVNALASRNDASSTVRAMVGMHKTTASSSVDVVFTSFPDRAGAVDVSVSRFVNNNLISPRGEPKAQPAVPPHTSFAR